MYNLDIDTSMKIGVICIAQTIQHMHDFTFPLCSKVLVHHISTSKTHLLVELYEVDNSCKSLSTIYSQHTSPKNHNQS